MKTVDFLEFKKFYFCLDACAMVRYTFIICNHIFYGSRLKTEALL